jgi:hypothetical protein
MRLPLAASCTLLALWAGPGCVAGTVTAPMASSSASSGDRSVSDPRDVFNREVLPLLDGRCASCHVDQADTPAFMAGPDVYASMMAHPGLIVPGEPAASLLIMKGSHGGPAWTASEERTVASWIDLEGGVTDGPADDGGSGSIEDPRSDRATSPMPVNHDRRHGIPLSELGFPNAEFSFYATRDGDRVVLSDLAFKSGTSGLHVVHPRIYIHAGTGAPWPDEDRFSAIDLVIGGDSIASLSTTIIITGFPDPGAVSIDFASLTSL